MKGILIIGAGECGVRAAFSLRERGYEGSVTLLSAETHLPYERPPLSKSGIPQHKPIRADAAYADAKIDLRLGLHVTAIDPAAKTIGTDDGTQFSYDRLLIATGARSRLFPGMEKARTLRTFDDAQAIFERLKRGTRLAVIGGGFIGLELAAAARGLGAEVTVIEAGSHLMARAVPAQIAALIEERHCREGVHLMLDCKVETISDKGVETGDGFVAADIIVAGVGAVPNTALAEQAGLTVDNGIRVDACFRTSERDVYAAGDCCSFQHQQGYLRLESWRVAQEQGAHAAAAILGDDTDFVTVPWFWSDQYDLGLQVAGLMQAGTMMVMRDLGEGAVIAFQFTGDRRLVCAAGVGPGNAVAKDIRLAEMLIARGARPDPEDIANPAISLKSLLKAA